MATFSKRTNQAGEVTHQAKCRRQGFRTVSKTFQTLADAKKWARSVERAWDSGEVPASDEPQRPTTTLADILRRYREEVAPTHKGCEIEVLGINALLRDYRAFADTPICDLSPSVMASWRDERLKAVKPSSVARQMNVLYSAINKARLDWGLPIPECKIKRPKSPPHRDRVLSDEEEVKLLAACSNEYLSAAIKFALATSMRAGEIIALRWTDVDEKRKRARVREAKNGTPRDVPLSSKALAALEGLDRSTKRVFEGLTSETLKRSFIRLTRNTEIANLHFHDLRHTALTRYAKTGLNPMQLRVISGHQDIKMLSRYPLLDKKIYAYVSRATVNHLRAAYVHDSLPGDSDYFLKVQDYDDQDWLSHIVTVSPSREGQYVVVPVTFGSTDQVRVRVFVVKEGGTWKVVKVENGER